MANRPPQASKTATSQGLFQARAAIRLSAVFAVGCGESCGSRGWIERRLLRAL